MSAENYAQDVWEACENCNLSFGRYQQIPPQLLACSDLSKVKHLTLSHNPITSLPPTISRFYNVVSLGLTFCNLSDIPDEIGTLTRLKSIHAMRNRFTSFPVALTSVTSLTELSLARNDIQSLPHTLSRLSGLIQLSLSVNQLTDLSPLVSLPRIQDIDLSGNRLESIPPLTALTSLRRIDLQQNCMREFDFSLLPLNVEALNLGYISCNIVSIVPHTRSSNEISQLNPNISLLTNLKSLDLSYNNFTAEDLAPEKFRPLTRLQSLCTSFLLTLF